MKLSKLLEDAKLPEAWAVQKWFQKSSEMVWRRVTTKASSFFASEMVWEKPKRLRNGLGEAQKKALKSSGRNPKKLRNGLGGSKNSELVWEEPKKAQQ